MCSERWYQLAYDLKDKNVGEVRKDWVEHLTNKDNVYPAGCRQGNPLFSPNKFYRANPDLKESFETNDDGAASCFTNTKLATRCWVRTLLLRTFSFPTVNIFV